MTQQDVHPDLMVKVIEIYQREDGKWAWRGLAYNNQIVAVDGSQGYENEADAHNTAVAVINGTNTAEVVTL